MPATVIAIVVASVVAAPAAAADGERTPAQIFQERIMPIFRSPKPSSCAQCHLAGVDLKNYILPSHEKTFLSLRDQGLIDLETPAQSKILRFIARGEDDPGARLIPAATRKAELEAFAAWIAACCRDPALRDAPKLAAAEVAAPKRPPEVIRHARSDRVLESFERNVWSVRFRCIHCHAAEGKDNRRLVAEHDESVTWMKATPAETMAHLLASGNVDVASPARSRLLLKPLEEVKHGGGKKMNVGDTDYLAFRAWLEDYARTARDGYAKASELPQEPQRFGTEIWLRMERFPPDLRGAIARLAVHAWDDASASWETQPLAMASGEIAAHEKFGIFAHGMLLLQAAEGSPRAQAWSRGKPTLPDGRYLVKVYVDTRARVLADPARAFGADRLRGQVEVRSRWSWGFGSATVVQADRLTR